MARSAPPTAIPKTVGPEQRGPPETGRRGAPACESSRAIDNRSSTRFFSFFEGLNTATRRAGIEESGCHFLVAKDRRPFGLALRRWRHVDEFIHVLTGG